MGKKRFSRDIIGTDLQNNGSCFVCVIYFKDIETNVYCCDEDKVVSLLMCVARFDTVDKAFSEFREGVFAGSYSGNYADCNDYIVPSNIDKSFSMFFFGKSGSMGNRINKAYNEKEQREIANYGANLRKPQHF